MKFPWTKDKPQAFAASVAQYNLNDRRALQSLSEVARPVAAKQTRAWNTYESNPLLSRGITFLGNSIGRLRVVPAFDNGSGDGPEENTTNEKANSVLADLDENMDAKGSMAGIRYLTRSVGIHLALPAEGFFHAREEETEEGVQRMYSVYSTDELRRQSARYEYVAFPGATPKEIKVGPEGTGYILRFWRPHERYSELAHSEIFSLLDDLDDWETLTAACAATDKSRIGAGILPLVGDVNWPADPNGRHKGGNAGFVMDMLDHFTRPLHDRGSAASVVPFIMGGLTKDTADGLKPVQFGRQVQEIDVKRLEELKDRIALGLPIPPETLFGKGDLNHWTGFLISEDEWKAVEPFAQLVFGALTRGVYRPTLIAMGMPRDEANKWWLWYDEVDLVHRPDQSGNATEGLKLGAIGPRGWREIVGIDESAAPTPEELEQIKSVAQARNRVQPGQESREEPPQNPPTGITAAMTPEQKAITKLGPKLSHLDRELRTKLQLGGEMAVKEAVKRVGAKLRSKLNPDQKRQFATTSNYELPAHLGRALVAQSGIDAPKAIAESLEAFIQDASRWMNQTWDQATAAISQAVSLPPPPNTALAAAVQELRKEMQAEAETRLWAPFPAMPDKGEWGEGLTAAILPAIRRVLKIAGGATDRTSVFDEGIATGSRILSAIADAFSMLVQEEGASLKTVYVWNHTPGAREFPGHAQLDGLEFDSMDDPGLVVQPEDEWLGTLFYRPGDHDGCLCDVDVELRLEV